MCCVVIPVCMENPPPRSNGRSSFVCERGHGIIAASTKEVGFPCETKRYWSQRGGLKKGRWVGWSRQVVVASRFRESLHQQDSTQRQICPIVTPIPNAENLVLHQPLYLLLHWQCDGRRTKNDSEHAHGVSLTKSALPPL